MATYKYLNDDGVKYIFAKIKAAQTAATNAAQTAIANMKKASMVVLEYGTDLPAAAESVSNVIYLKKPTANSTAYDEYICVDVSTTSTPSWAWEKIGSTDIDLNNYVKATAPSSSGSGDAVTGISITNQQITYTKGSVGRKVKKGSTEVAKGTDITLSDGSSNGDVQWTLNSNGTLTAKVLLATWAKGANAPTLDSISDGSTRKLANYIPKAGTDALSGSITPSTNSTSDSTGVNLGSSSKRFNYVHARELDAALLKLQEGGNEYCTIEVGQDGAVRFFTSDGQSDTTIALIPNIGDGSTHEIAFRSDISSLNTLGNAYTTAELDALWAAA